ncbi:hypothetical protein P7H20_25495 [Paenibacillus larvae]|nr:hypothetical protein [Paenibacillus larvae]MDT2277523.1 hypothetical protein [Paenibacillus larvae]
MGPVGLIIAAIAGVIAIIIMNWDSIKEFFINLWNSIVSYLSEAWEASNQHVLPPGSSFRIPPARCGNSIKDFSVGLRNGIGVIIV